MPSDGLRRTQFANLRLLTSGTVPANPAELLASKRGMAVLKSIGPEQDLIVIDTAPAGLVTDPLSVAAGASATILVVEAGKTKASQAGGTIDALREVGANVIGVVLNKASRRISTGYYYQYGHSQYGQAHSAEPFADAGRSRAAPGQRGVLKWSRTGAGNEPGAASLDPLSVATIRRRPRGRLTTALTCTSPPR